MVGTGECSVTRSRTDPATAIATVGGLGRVAWAPGTWGSIVGLILGVLCVREVSSSLTLRLAVLTFIACALICDAAERRLHRHDPPSVILDEVWGMWLVVVTLPWTAAGWLRLLLALALFRLFDITKPQPVPALERLPGGWGIMADDFGASVYAILVLWILKTFAVVF